MERLVDQVEALFATYPSWLVGLCMAIVGAGLLYVLWRVIKVSMIIVVTVLLLGIAGFAGWVIFAS